MNARRVQDERSVTLLGRAVAYRLRPSPRAKAMRIRVGPGGVEVLMPRRATATRAADFLQENAGWVLDQSARAERLRVARADEIDLPPGHLLLRGEPTPVVFIESANRRQNSVELSGGRIVLRCGVGGVPPERSLEGWLRNEARRDLAVRVARRASEVSQPHGRLYVRGQRTRWGSCSGKGNLSFNWRLVMAPPAVLDYVVAHELAHLDVPNHSPAFWLKVRAMCPAYAARRDWLRRHGPTLLADPPVSISAG